jgi:hypothetical protein
MKSKNRKIESAKTAKKNDQSERPVTNEELKGTGKKVTASKGSFRSVEEVKGKSQKK